MKTKIVEFKKLDIVKHVTKLDQEMIVIDINQKPHLIKCRWVSSVGVHEMDFMAEELIFKNKIDYSNMKPSFNK